MTDTLSSSSPLQHALDARYSDAPDVSGADSASLLAMARRGSCRTFQDQAVPKQMINMLCAVALAAPSKSDLQQRDIIVLHSAAQRQALAALVPGQAWVAQAPMLLVFCGNNRRQRLIQKWQNIPFANDHFDAVFNATADAAIALGAFMTAAEASGLGCCPISAIRNEARAVADLLGLPDHVFPFAGLALGYSPAAPPISMRLPLSVTCHEDRYSEDGLRGAVASYDQTRAAARPYGTQRLTDVYGSKADYGWSDDKARQYSQPERADFGAYIRSIGFRLD